MLHEIIYHIKVGIYQQAQFLKGRMSYYQDFIIGAFANTLLHVVNLIFITVIFQKIPELRGWAKYEVFFIYGMSIIPFSIFNGLFSHLYFFSNLYIIEGTLDRILLRPANGLVQVYTSQVALEDIADVILGVGIVIWASHYLSVQWGIIEILGLILFSLCGVGIFLGIFTTLASLSFWFSDRVGLIPPVYNMIQFGRYPLTIYNPVLRFVLSWVIPFGFIGFYPSTWLIRRGEFFNVLLVSPIVAIICMVVGVITWNNGLKQYESTGS